MILKNLTAIGLLAMATIAATATYAAGPSAKISDLAWMTGNYAAALGPNQLEENWIMGEGGSLAAIVRMTGNGSTSMFEVITIEEVDGSLVLHLQQWDAGFMPRTESAQKMELVEFTKNSVKFNAVSEGGMSTLGYSKPDANSFIIHVGQPSGETRDIKLSTRSIWK